jgi:hypothetical protein
MGWNLFRIGVVNPQSGELRGKSWGVKLQKCGPGVFFSAFGTAILIWALSSPLSLTPTGPFGKKKFRSGMNRCLTVDRFEIVVSNFIVPTSTAGPFSFRLYCLGQRRPAAISRRNIEFSVSNSIVLVHFITKGI